MNEPPELQPTAPMLTATLSGGARGTREPSGSRQRFVPGVVLGRRFRIVGLLGQGGMGEVYRAEDLRLGETVALKLLPAELARDAAALDRLHREVRLARQVAHPNVCRVFDVGEAEGLAFISMEYIDGEDLASLLRRIGRLPESKAIEVARQLCAGLAAAHEKGVLHRDLKPANVMIDGRGRARISDFGLAVPVAEATTGELAGTPLYMAPEQLARGEVSFRSDVYSLGLILYECLTGRRPFEGASRAELMSLQRSGMPSSPARDVIGLDPVVERVVMRCLEPEPADRPATALEVAAALPGGDPLAAAIAAGETPSPEMVAASPRSGLLSVRAALGWTALAVATLPFVWVGAADMMAALGTNLRSPVVLADRAAELARRLDVDIAGDSVWGWRLRTDYLARFGELDGSQQRAIAAGPTPPLRFWYREAVGHLMAPTGYSAVDEPALGPGDVAIELTPSGALRLVDVRPAPSSPVSVAAPPEPWALLFELAGLEEERATPVEPEVLPPAFASERFAWEVPFREDPEVLARVEAGTLGGQVVWFRVFEPLDSREGPRTAWTSRTLLLWIIAMIAVSTVVGVVLARRNLRSGRGDPQGAARLGLVIAATSFAGWFLSAHHGASFSAVRGFVGQLGVAFVRGAWVWLVYLALEPLMRRRWPDGLVSWSRLLAGRVGDPLIARDVFLGATLGLVVRAIEGAALMVARGTGMAPPMAVEGWLLPGLTSAREGLGVALADLTFVPLFNALAFVLMLIGIEALVRQRRPAVLVLAALASILMFAAGVGPSVAMIQGLVFAFATAHLGLLAAASMWVVFFGLMSIPLVASFGAWYGGGSMLGHGVLVALLVWVWSRSVLTDGRRRGPSPRPKQEAHG